MTPGTAAATAVHIEDSDSHGDHDLLFPLTAVPCGPRTDFADGCDANLVGQQ